MDKRFNHKGEPFILKDGTIEEIKNNYDKKKIYLTYDEKAATDVTTRLWYVVYEQTEETRSRTWLYSAGISEEDMPLYNKVASALGYLYDEEGLKWIQKITSYKKVRKEDIF